MMAGQGPERPDTAGRRHAPAPSRPQPTRQAASPLAEMWDWVRGRLVVAGRGLLLLGLALTGLALLLAVLSILGLVRGAGGQGHQAEPEPGTDA